MRVCIDKTRGQRFAGGDDFAIRGHTTQIANRLNAIATYRHIGAVTRQAGAIENIGIPDNQITTEAHARNSFVAASSSAPSALTATL